MKKHKGYVEYQDLRLPPRDMVRHGGKTDEHHVRSARDIVERTERLAGLNANSRVLDVGCGAGRFLIGMLSKYGRVARYVGVDVRQPVVEWCQETLIQPERGNIEFAWLDVKNSRYNRRGHDVTADRIFPLQDNAVDVIVLFSVFSHMTSETAGHYLREITRVLAKGGRCLCTAYVEDDVPDWEENPANYVRDWKGPLHCTRFSKTHLAELIHGADLDVEHFKYRDLQGRQSTYVLQHAP